MTRLLLKLLGAPTDEADNIVGASFSFHGGISIGWFIFGLLLLGLLSWWVYRSSPVPLSAGRRFVLTALRGLFLVAVLSLLVRPILALTVEGSVRRALVLMFDSSLSMRINDPRLSAEDQKRVALAKGILDPGKGLGSPLDPGQARDSQQSPRLDLVKSVLKNPRLNLLPRLDKEFDLDAYAFGPGLVSIPARKESTNAATRRAVSVDQFTWVDRLTATNSLTAIGDGLREVLHRKRGQPLAGVLLVTDGANNSGLSPLEVAREMRANSLPLYIYGVGMTSPRDIIVGNIFAPEVSFVKDDVPVTVRVRSQGLSGQAAELRLNLGDNTVATTTVTFSGDGEQVVPMRFTPPQAGEFSLQASIAPRADEAVKDNNSRSQRLRVIDTKIKALLIDQQPRWEYRYLAAMLARDRRIDLKLWLVEGDQTIARGEKTPYLGQFPANKDELFQYDLVLLGDVDPKRLSGAQLDNLSELVSRFGGAVVVVAGKRFLPWAYRHTVLEKMLPVEFESPGVETPTEPVFDKPVTLELTGAGAASSMLRLSDQDKENKELWQQLPPVFWVARVLRAKPAAEVLLVDPDPSRESRFGKMPVVALQQYGLGTVLYVGTDNTWRWRKNVGDIYYTALWGQMAERVSLPRLLGGSKRTQLTTDRQNYLTGERVSVYARLYTVGFEPVQEPVIRGVYGLKSGQGTRNDVTLRAVPEQPGLYRAEFIAGAPGTYQFFIEQDLNTGLDFNVTEPDFELGDTAMNEPLLKELAGLTAGGFFREEDLWRLPQAISQKTERVRSPLEVELWSSPAWFLLMLLVVTTEWILRKLWHLK